MRKLSPLSAGLQLPGQRIETHMFDIFGMHDHIAAIFLIVGVELLEMMDLVFPLVVAVVTGASSEVGQDDLALCPLVATDPVGVLGADQLSDGGPDLVGGLVTGRRRFVDRREPVRAEQLIAREVPVIVEVVQREEGASVVVKDVVLGDHVPLCPRQRRIRVVVRVVEAAAVRERQRQKGDQCEQEAHRGRR